MAPGVPLFSFLGPDVCERRLEFEPSPGSAGGKIERLEESLKSRIELANKFSSMFMKIR